MTTPALDTTDSRAAWLEQRRKVITGTDLAALFGVSRYKKSAMDVWLDKTGRAPADEDNGALRFGRRFERPILEEYAERHKVELTYPGAHALIVSPKYDFIGATLDAQHVDDKTPVDAKNLGYRTAEFGPDGSDIVPLAYALQLTAQMIVTGAERSALAVLFNRYEFNTFYVALDPLVVERVLERAQEFMTQYVKTDTPPPVDGSTAWSTWLGSHLKQRTKTILPSTPVEHELAISLNVTNEQIKELNETAESLKNQLKLAIGDAGGMEGPDWRITWTQAKDKTKIDWEGVARNLAQLLPPGEGSDALNRQLAAHTTTSPGSRSFRFAFQADD
jgi:putative phage-type endonuclease